MLGGTGAQLDRLVSQEIKLFTRVVREQGIKAEQETRVAGRGRIAWLRFGSCQCPRVAFKAADR